MPTILIFLIERIYFSIHILKNELTLYSLWYEIRHQGKKVDQVDVVGALKDYEGL